jgi:DNA-binding NarL/FixJ family response regulator
MTRVAVIAASEELRAALAAALRAAPGFDVVAVGATERDAPASADVIITAHPADDATPLAQSTPRGLAGGTVLTNREREILALLADGLGNKQIAGRLGISTHTVKTHLELLFDKLRVSSRAEAVATGVKRGLLLL